MSDAAPRTVGEVFTALGGGQAVASILGISAQAVSNMKQKGWIPPRRWAPLVAEAKARNLPGITFETLAAIRPEHDVASAAS